MKPLLPTSLTSRGAGSFLMEGRVDGFSSLVEGGGEGFSSEEKKRKRERDEAASGAVVEEWWWWRRLRV